MTDDTCLTEDVFAKAIEWVEFEAEYQLLDGAEEDARQEALRQVTILLAVAAELLFAQLGIRDHVDARLVLRVLGLRGFL